MMHTGEIDLKGNLENEPEKSPVVPPAELPPVNANPKDEKKDSVTANVITPEGKAVPVEVTVGSKDDSNKPAHQKFDEMERKFNRNILEIKTLFPFAFFPTYVIVDEAQVIIIEYFFFFSKRVFPMFIKDLKTVTATQGIILGQIKFELSGYEDNPGIINNLKRGDVIKARRIILGLMKAHEERIDLSQFSDEELKQRLETLGEKYGKA